MTTTIFFPYSIVGYVIEPSGACQAEPVQDPAVSAGRSTATPIEW